MLRLYILSLKYQEISVLKVNISVVNIIILLMLRFKVFIWIEMSLFECDLYKIIQKKSLLKYNVL